MMNQLFAINNPVSSSVQVPLPDVYSAAAEPATVSAQVLGGIDFIDEFDHHVQLSADSIVLQSIAFGGPESAMLEGQIATDQLGSVVDVQL